MDWNFLFFMNSALLGVGLAMDAFSVSLANGMNEKNDEEISYGLYCRSVCIFSVSDAYGGLDLRTYNCAAIWSVSEMYPLDRINTIALYWRKHDMGISKRRRRN